LGSKALSQDIAPCKKSPPEVRAKVAAPNAWKLADKSAKNKREASASTAGNEIVSAAAADASSKRRRSSVSTGILRYFSGDDTFLR